MNFKNPNSSSTVKCSGQITLKTTHAINSLDGYEKLTKTRGLLRGNIIKNELSDLEFTIQKIILDTQAVLMIKTH